MREIGCRSCGSRSLVPVLSLGEMPLANGYLRPEEAGSPELRFPLDAVFCPSCALFQITESVPPDTLFREYLYLSSCSETFVAHARALAARVCRERGLGADSLVVEIASNDGYLLADYVARGIPVVGIEPARNIAALARERGVRTISEFFGVELAGDLAREYGRADVIHANNVLAHVPDLNGVVAGFSRLLKDEGVAIVEVPYLREMIDRVEFDAIYHEHLCYFSLTAIAHLAARHSLAIVDVEHVPVHGGTLRISLQIGRDRTRAPRVEALLAEEHALGMDTAAYYTAFAGRVARYRQNLMDVLDTLHARGETMAGYGAAAKSTTLLHYCGIDARMLAFIVDRNQWKQGCLTPGTHIPIAPPERLLAEMPAYTLLLVWNFADEVLRQQAEYRSRGGRFVIPALDPLIV